MVLSFPRSAECEVSGNILVAPGKITVTQPGAIRMWTNNLVIRDGLGAGGAPQPFVITDAMPPSPPPARRTAPFGVARVATPPTLDGEIGWDEWPGPLSGLDKDSSRWGASGAPAFAKFAWDDRCLYVAVNVVVFDAAPVRTGAVWGVDAAAEVRVEGVAADGRPVVFVLRGFAGGALQSVADGGASAEVASAMGRAARFAGRTYGSTRGGWRGEWAIPFEALGLTPAPGLRIPFNVAVHRSEDGVRRYLEGTLGETWRLAEAAVLQLQ